MSLKIDQEKIAAGELTEDEVRYLTDRNLLPADYTGKKVKSKVSDPTPLDQLPNTGDANTKGLVNQPVEVKDDEDDDEDSSSDEDEVEDYDEGWTNDDRRGELQKRGLSIEGNKQELIDRLLEDDQK